MESVHSAQLLVVIYLQISFGKKVVTATRAADILSMSTRVLELNI